MNISSLSVRRPVLTVMASLIVIILGGVSLFRLPIDLMPDITNPTISITSVLENASPEEIEELITRPLEEAMSAVPGVDEVTSISAEGQGRVRVTFTWGTDLDAAANDIRDRLDRVIPRLPEDAERPMLRKYDLAAFPILYLGVASELDPIQVRRIIDNQVKNRIERIPGVASLDVRGGLDREIHVDLDAEKIKALGLPIDQILSRIKDENINLPAGTIEQGKLDITIRTPGVYNSLDELRNTVVAVRDGAPIQLKEIATVEDAWEKVVRIRRVNGRPGVILAVNKQSGKNTVEVANGVLRELERINRDLPQLNIITIIDTSDYIKRSITNVGTTILYGGALAVIVLLFFLRHIPSTAIIATTIPISVVATFALMFFNGFTLNLMTVLGLALLVLLGSLLLIPLVGVELMPASDESEVRVYAEMAVGTRLELVDQVFQRIEDVVRKEVPEREATLAFIGGSTWRSRGSNAGEMRINLKPVKERTRSSEEIAGALRKKLVNMPGVKIRTRAGQGLFILRMFAGGEDKVQMEIRGHDLEISDMLARRVEEIIAGVDGITDTRMSRETGTPEELVIVDRQKAADMKLTVSNIAKMLQTVLTGTAAGNFREGGNEYKIRVKLQGAEKMNLRDILDLPITNAEAERVVLRNVVEVRPRRGPIFIERKDQERVVYVTANISGRDMGSILSDIRERLREVPVPRDFSIVFGGDYEEQQRSFRELLISFVLALILVYMVMASLYESLRYPFVVMFSVPLAAIGVILMLFLTGTTFNIQSYIGCIMLGGIVVNNAILLVDHINLLRQRDGLAIREAIEEAGRRRLRPILMTAMTTTLAMTPLALGMGEGGEAQAPMARAIIGGLLSSNLITLIVVPTVYALFERRRLKAESAVDSLPSQRTRLIGG
jgi:multidrug efflux pump subunit AcrB